MTPLSRVVHYCRIVKDHPNPVAFVTSRLLRAGGVSQLVTMRFPRFRLRLYPSAISEAYFTRPNGRDDDHGFFERYLRPGDTVVDVGANVGALTVHAAALVGPAGRVISFEPHPRIHAYLRGNVALNRAVRVTAHQVALGARAGTVEFTDLKSDDRNAVEGGGTVSVPVATLDSFLGDVPAIDLLKVDVEGYEREVFRGAAATLRRTACVFFESWEDHYRKYGHGTPEVVALLAEAGLVALRVEGDDVAEVPADYRSRRCENLVAVRDPAAFRARWRRLDAR